VKRMAISDKPRFLVLFYIIQGKEKVFRRLLFSTSDLSFTD